MRRTLSRTASFTTIRTEGAILPPDILRRIQDGDETLPGLNPDAYHLPGGMRLGEATSRAWNALLGAWSNFQDARERLPSDDPGTTITRERWLLAMFQELNYGRLQTRTYDDIDGKSYPISHGYGHAPIHLVGCNIELDRRTAGVAGAARTSPHGLVQEYLNRSDEHLWGVVSNGLKLRLLRDNLSLTRQAYVEFDLVAMMEGEVYSDFALLYLTLHQSRFDSELPGDALIEQWSKLAVEEGARALDTLREGVEGAIRALGQGFLQHPANDTLRDDLRSGGLNRQDYYRQLLRLVYRLLFLFVAEDRERLLVVEPDSPEASRYRFYSTARLRELADSIRGSRHADLYESLKLVMQRLGSDDGAPALGLPALGGYLFSERATPGLANAQIANAHLLQAVRGLAYVTTKYGRRPVDYKNLGSEELGSIYESLLELHPDVNVDAGTFQLDVAAGSERKTTGSYYTPSSLISLLLDSALDPVIDESVRGKAREEAERALLDLKIVDPAVGSGHFLIAAAQRMAKRLASVRTGDDEPAPAVVQSALRDVIGRCLYGVDVNEMAAELCKVALWMEALEPGKPLTFLDHHIQVGNSLFGTTRTLIEKGIPDDAYGTLERDDKNLAKAAKAQNKKERGGEVRLFGGTAPGGAGVAGQFQTLTDLPDDSLAALHAKERRYRQLIQSDDYALVKLIADAWCAAFVWRLEKNRPNAITTGDLHQLREQRSLSDRQRMEVQRIAKRYAFLHWHVAFPDVFPPGEDGGFDVVLGNPPWEHTELKEREWFAGVRPVIANATPSSKRKKLIEDLEQGDPALYDDFVEAKRMADGVSHFARNSDRYPLCGRGRINTYALFAELDRDLTVGTGRTGIIVPSGIATDATTQYYFQDLVDRKSLVSLYDFENRKGLFPDVDSRMKFCLLTLSGEQRFIDEAYFCFFAHDVSDVHDPERRFTLAPEEIALLNPNTKTLPVFRSSRDAELTKSVYRRVPVLIDEQTGANPWGVEFKRGLYNMASDSSVFRSDEELLAAGLDLVGNSFVGDGVTFLPLYEAKLFHFYDHRWATYDDGVTRYLSQVEKDDPTRLVKPRYWVEGKDAHTRAAGIGGISKGVLAYRWITNTTNERTFVVCSLPPVAVGDSVALLTVSESLKAKQAALQANLSSLAFDYCVRQMLGGTNMTLTTVRQLPALPPSSYSQLELEFVICRVRELQCTAWDVVGTAPLGHPERPYRWEPARRSKLRAELDALYFLLYGLNRSEVSHVIDTFTLLRDHEVGMHGDFRTKNQVLTAYDRLAECRETGGEYESLVAPDPEHVSQRHELETRPAWEA